MSESVIIDGVNVAECEFYENKYCKLCDMKAALDELIVHRQYCDRTINHNCYFKQLQRAQAENEKLKNRNKLYKKIIKENIEKANNNFMILTACIQGNLSIEEVKEYAKLKAKIDELKRKLKSYKQALKEIKEIAKTKFVNGLSKEADIYNVQMIKIENTINEVLD